MTTLPTPCDNIARLAPYPLDGAASVDSPDVANLQFNEHWEQPGDAVRAACLDAMATGHLYPETSASRLRTVLATRYGIDPNQIVCANGSSELISLLCDVYCRGNDEVVVGPYSYMFFRTASQIAGATPVMASCTGLTLKVEDLLNAVTSRTRIVFIDNPQNPLGDYLTEGAVHALRKELPERVLLVIDAAYAEYVDADDYNAGIGLVDAYPNTVMLRTFSKIHGLAGLRVGWAYGAHEIVDLMHRVRQPNNLTGVSIAAAVASMEDPGTIERRFRVNRDWRDNLITLLGERFQFSVRPSQANFVLAAVPEWYKGDAAQLAASLSRCGVFVRPMASYGLPDHVRITIGPERSINRLLDAMPAALGRPPSSS